FEFQRHPQRLAAEKLTVDDEENPVGAQVAGHAERAMLEPDGDHGLHTLMLALQANCTGRVALPICDVLHGRHHGPPSGRLMSAVSYKSGCQGNGEPKDSAPGHRASITDLMGCRSIPTVAQSGARDHTAIAGIR